MTDEAARDQSERYDRMAVGYERWWAPVIAPYGTAVLDHLERAVANGARELLDVGTGTGAVAFAALRRWPGVRVTGIDPSGGMLDVARARAGRELTRAQGRRFTLVKAFGDRLPFDDGRFDAAASAFVLQLVPRRGAVLREVRRVLRPGGRLALVTWLRGERTFAADTALDDALDDAGLEPRGAEERNGDLPSARATAGSLRAAGFRAAVGDAAEFTHAWDVERYLEFVERFDEEDLFASEEPADRDRLRDAFRARLSALRSDELVMRYPIVYASGVRP